MCTVEVKLSAIQLGECRHKAYILQNTEDLQESYSMTQAEANAMATKMMEAKPGIVLLTRGQAMCLVGELEDSAEIARANLEDGDEDSRGLLVSILHAIKKLKTALACV